MDLLTPADWPAIRSLVDVRIDTSIIPDDVIALDVYSGAAQRAVLQRDPAAETRGGSERDHARAAAMYLTAALLAPAVLLRQEYERDEGGSKERVRYGTQDVAARVAELRNLASAELDAYLNTDTVPAGEIELPTLFVTARGWRGR